MIALLTCSPHLRIHIDVRSAVTNIEIAADMNRSVPIAPEVWGDERNPDRDRKLARASFQRSCQQGDLPSCLLTRSSGTFMVVYKDDTKLCRLRSFVAVIQFRGGGMCIVTFPDPHDSSH